MIDHVVGIALIVFVAPLVGLLGSAIGHATNEKAGTVVSVGGVLAVLGVAAWFLVRSF
ncbi:hypothetical protein [Streptomyces roseoviridis]|uniref:Uncharacterized protein n=1 Tax=Streptomyces roseoviridis TaxID=67361 RepID=A0ABV5QT81_9ACTN